MAIRVVINTHAHEDVAPEMMEYWRSHSAMCREQEGNLQYEVFRSITYPENFALLELWQDQRTYDAHWEIEQTIDKPQFNRGERQVGRDGVEFYHDHAYWKFLDGVWQPVEKTA